MPRGKEIILGRRSNGSNQTSELVDERPGRDTISFCNLIGSTIFRVLHVSGYHDLCARLLWAYGLGFGKLPRFYFC